MGGDQKCNPPHFSDEETEARQAGAWSRSPRRLQPTSPRSPSLTGDTDRALAFLPL